MMHTGIMDRCVDGWMDDVYMFGFMHAWKDEWMNEQCIHGWIHGLLWRCMDGYCMGR